MHTRRRVGGGIGLAALAMLVVSLATATAGVRLGFEVVVPPPLIAIPSSPVQYAPSVAANYFFYGGRYYVFADDVWYASSGYDGPWLAVAPGLVPPPLLTVPIAYYRFPAPAWGPWRRDRPPRWEAAYIRHPDERHGFESRGDGRHERHGHRG